jgi:drug/metabolite transporter (DMT)-like permease
MSERVTPFVMLIVAAALYGSLFSTNKIAAEAGVPPIGYAFWQSLLAGLVLLAADRLRGGRLGTSWAHIRAYLVIGALAICLPMALLTHVAPNLPASIVTLVLALSPSLTFLLSMAVRIERPYWFGMAGLVCGFAGVMVLVGPTAALPDTAMVGWFLISLAAPAMFAGANVSAALLRPGTAGSLSMAAGTLLGSAAFAFVIMLASGHAYWLGTAPAASNWALAAASTVNMLVVVLFFEIIRRAGPIFFAQFNYLAVLSGIGWGWLVFSETLNHMVWVAFLLMAVGVILTSLKPRTPAKAQLGP